MRTTVLTSALAMIALTLIGCSDHLPSAPSPGVTTRAQRLAARRRHDPVALAKRVLLKGIKLTPDQRTQLRAVRKAEAQRLRGAAPLFSKLERSQLAAARQHKDTATAHQLRTVLAGRIVALRELEFAKIRAILTPGQTKRFDQNAIRYVALVARAERRTGSKIFTGYTP
jgi:Spy/CpxP family protein refolding chaperone